MGRDIPRDMGRDGMWEARAAGDEEVCGLLEDRDAVSQLAGLDLLLARAQGSLRECIVLCGDPEAVRAVVRAYLVRVRVRVGALLVQPGLRDRFLALRWVLSRDTFLGPSLRALLLLALSARPSRDMGLAGCPETLVDSFGTALRDQSRLWVCRAVQVAGAGPEKSWAVDLVGEQWRSFLPEAAAQQMQVFLDLCRTGGLLGPEEATRWQGLCGRVKAGLQKMDPSGLARDLRDLPGTDPRGLQLRVQERLVASLARALLILGDEYLRALRSRHWDQGHTDLHIQFLAAVTCDCHRVCGPLLEPWLSVELVSNLQEVLARAIGRAFLAVRDTALRALVRIVFANMHGLLLCWDTLWGQGPGAARSLIQTLAFQLGPLSPLLPPDAFLRVLRGCREVVTLRWLCFLRDRARQGLRLGEDELSRLQSDVAALQTCLGEGPEKEEGPWWCLDTLLALLTLDYGTAGLCVAVNGLASRCRAGLAEAILVHCVCVLRPTAHPDLRTFIGAALARASPSSEGPGPGLMADDLFDRVFSDRNRHRGPEEGRSVLALLRSLRRPPPEERFAGALMATLGLLDHWGGDWGLEEEGEGDWGLEEAPHGPRILRVSGLRVRGLQAHLSAAPRPYVAVTLHSLRLKTPVSWTQPDAEWPLMVMDFPEGHGAGPLEVRVFDKERLSRKRLLGAVSVRLAGLGERSVESWYALQGGASCAGEVFLRMELL
mmetsp:Transcript_30331/g.43399  ORF Transcript_30331/g.43399 Transcript_30331/m.43399 type:complete len:716 (+) Transcript_30331:2172-4319(+)